MGVEKGQRCNRLNTRTTGATSKQTPNWDVFFITSTTPYKTYLFFLIHMFFFYLYAAFWLGEMHNKFKW